MRFGRSQPLLAWISLFAITIVPAVGAQRACRAIGTMGHTNYLACPPKRLSTLEVLGTRLFPAPPWSIPVL